jgi:RNA polymerase sigma-70 factor (ECF subfamily)
VSEIPADQHQRFLRLFMACEPAVRAFVRSLVPTLADSNDVMQEIAIVLWQKFGEYETTEDFRRWCFRVAKWKVLAWQRDRMRDRHVFGVDTTEVLAEAAESRSEVLELQREALRECLRKLSDGQRELVDHVYGGRARIQELAQRIGVSSMSLYKKLHRIRVALIDCTRRVLVAGRMS